MAGQVGGVVVLVEPADLAAQPAVVLVVLRFAQHHADPDRARALVERQVARLHHGQEGEDGGLGVLALHVAEVLVVLVHGVLDQPGGDAGVQQAEVFDVERHRFLVLPGRQQLGVVVVGAQQPGAAAGVADLAPLAHQLAGVPVDPLAGLLVQVQADAVDVRGDFLVAVALGPAHQGGEGVADLLPFDVGHHGFEVAGPDQELDAAADGRLVIRGAGDQPVEGQRVLDGGLRRRRPAAGRRAARSGRAISGGPRWSS